MSTVIVVGCSMVGSGTRFRPTVPSIRHWEDVYDTSICYIRVWIHSLSSKVSTILLYGYSYSDERKIEQGLR